MPVEPSRAMLLLALFLGGWLVSGGESAAQEGLSLTQEATMTVAAKTTEISLPVKDSNFNLGDVIVRIAADSTISIQRAGFLSIVKRVLRDSGYNLDRNLPPSDFVTLAQIESAGLHCAYDTQNMEITISPKVEQRPRGEVTGAIPTQTPTDEALFKPAIMSGYANVHFGAAYTRQFNQPASVQFSEITLENSLRYHDIVLEAEIDVANDGVISSLKNRFVYDIPQRAIRVTAGDLTNSVGDSNMLPPMLGFSMQKSYQKLQPTKNVRPTGRRSFRVERPSEVDVMLNHRSVRRLKLGPGEYDLDSLPLTAGNNNIQLIIKDDVGREETIDFSILFDRTLLDVGISEWDFSAGFGYETNDPLAYDFSERYASASYRLGLLENMTGQFSLASDEETTNLSAGSLWQTALGLLTIDGSVSLKPGLLGASGVAEVEIPLNEEANRSIHLGLDFESSGFTSLGDEKTLDSDRLGARAAFSSALSNDVSATFSGHYAHVASENTFGVAASLSRAMGDGLSMSLSGGYGSEASVGARAQLLGGLTLYGRLNYRLGDSSSMSLGYDATARRFSASAQTASGSGVGGWSTHIEMSREPGREDDVEENSIEGSLAYIGNRFQLETTHGRDFTRLHDVRDVHHSATLGTSIAFADGSIAVGRPVRSSFAVVGMHPALAESELRLSPSANGDAAATDWLGPAVVSDISAYAPARLSYDVTDLPDGYDIGNGSFDMVAPYKGGYRLTVGSGFVATVHGNLSDALGKPLELLPGAAFEKRNPDRKVELFTNAEGRFGASGFGPGEWIIEIAGPGTPRFSFTLPADVVGVIDLGTLSPIPAVH